MPFREAIVGKASDANEELTAVTASVASGRVSVTVRAEPLPLPIIQVLEAYHLQIKQTVSRLGTALKNVSTPDDSSAPLDTAEGAGDLPANIKDAIDLENLADATAEGADVDVAAKLKAAFEECSPKWKAAFDRIWSFGPRRCGANILFNDIPDYKKKSQVENMYCLLTRFRFNNTFLATRLMTQDSDASLQNDFNNNIQLDEAINNGFQLATYAGPLCAEPMHGVAFFVVDYKLALENENGSESGTAHTVDGMFKIFIF